MLVMHRRVHRVRALRRPASTLQNCAPPASGHQLAPPADTSHNWRRLTDSFQRMKANPGEPVELKKFCFSSRTVSSRTVVGENFADYMSLPIEEYVLFDDRLMR